MNAEILICEAGVALSNWRRRHHSTCELYIENGHVACKKAPTLDSPAIGSLLFSCFYQEHGLSTKQWNRVGDLLMNLYNKEKSCQKSPKP